MNTQEQIFKYVAEKLGVKTDQIRNYADYRIRVHFPMSDAKVATARRFREEYNKLNDSYFGSAIDLCSEHYLAGYRLSGWSTHKMPQRSPEYDYLRDWMLDIIAKVQGEGFKTGTMECKEFWYRSVGYRYEFAITLDDKVLSQWRDDCYNRDSWRAEQEQEDERRMERRYEDMIIAHTWA